MHRLPPQFVIGSDPNVNERRISQKTKNSGERDDSE